MTEFDERLPPGLAGGADAVAGQTVAFEKVAPPLPGSVRELRLALVCYGGVSLAIYMHGITKEIHKLVLASAALEGHEQNPFAQSDSAHHYWELLRARQAATGVRVRVVVDILAGTSAGGINAIFLAAALARNRSQDPLRRMWLEKGDIRQLLGGPTWLPMVARVPALLRFRWSLTHPLSMKPPLRGDAMCQWIVEALRQMDAAPPKPLFDRDSLVPEQQRLQLFVPVTDFTGYDVRLPLDDPAWVADRTHRHVMRFTHDPTTQQLSSEWNDGLAFAARATSSFPGAFPPVSIGDYQRSVRDHRLSAAIERALFPGHVLAHRDPRDDYFVDGGVLDNKPFSAALEAIKSRPAGGEVDRRLLYIEPDPGAENEEEPDGRRPGWLATVVGGYAGIPRKEPILDDLDGIARRNADVERVRDIVESTFGQVRQRVREISDAGDRSDPNGMPVIGLDRLSAMRRSLMDAVEKEAGLAYPTYLRLRLRMVIEDCAGLIAARLCYPPGSTHRHFVRRVLRAWAAESGLLGEGPVATDPVRQFLEAFDLAYEERHLRFVIAALSWWYVPPRAGEPAADQDDPNKRPPQRRQLDRAKHRLYQRLGELHDVVDDLAGKPRIVELTDEVFGSSAIDAALDDRLTAEEVVARQVPILDALAAEVRRPVEKRLSDVRAAIDEDLVDLTGSWTAWARQEVLVRHVAFRFWDLLAFPVESLSGVGERDEVEVIRISPHEAKAIVSDPRHKDLAGVKLGHFGAFFSRAGRENDYLWGRLDGADRLVGLLYTGPGERMATPPSEAARPVFDAILSDETPNLSHIGDVVTRIRAAIGRTLP